MVCPISIGVAIACYLQKKSKRRTVTQPQATTVGMTTTTPYEPWQPHPSAYPTRDIYPALYSTVEGTYPQPYPPPQVK